MPDKIKNFWPGLLVLFVIYSAYRLLFVENISHSLNNIIYKYFFKGIVVFVIYFTGSYFLRKSPIPWLLYAWHIIHITLITILVSLWVWHFMIYKLPLNLKNLGDSIHEFLISPLLYLATGLLGKINDKNILP